MYGYGLPFAWLAQAMCPHHSATWRAVRRRPAAAMGLHFEHQRQLLAYLPAISADLPCARSNVAWGRQTAGGSTARLTSEAIWHQLLAHPSKPDSITHCTFLTPRLPPPRFFLLHDHLQHTSCSILQLARARANAGRVLDLRTGIFRVHPPPQSP
jgi:hypothetical protein